MSYPIVLDSEGLALTTPKVICMSLRFLQVSLSTTAPLSTLLDPRTAVSIWRIQPEQQGATFPPRFQLHGKALSRRAGPGIPQDDGGCDLPGVV